MPIIWSFPYVVLFLLATITTSNPVTTLQHLRLRQSGVSVVSGISSRDGNGNVPVRREVRDLQENHPDQWTLYLLALSSFQWLDQADSLSYYGIASIHGRPFRTWGDVPGIPWKANGAGYCPHSNPLFLPWHRPYLALFEEQLYKRVQHYVAEAPADQHERWQSAANSFRMPYWDWALGPSGGPVPNFFMTQMVNIVRPSGRSQELWNPLYAFYFHPLVPSDFEGKWSTINTTLRWPDTDTSTAVSNEQAMQTAFQGQQRGLHDHVDKAFRQSSLNDFSKVLEEAHGWVHGIIGGGWDGNSSPGHMWPLEYSAYEPMFMLHHTNVDRLYAMYQGQNPSRNLEPENIGNNGNVWLEDGVTVDATTPMLPFEKAAGGFWTTNDVRSTETFGYAYPETIKAVPQAGEEAEEKEDEEEEDEEEDEEDEEEEYDEENEEEDEKGRALSRAISASISKLYSSSARALLTPNAATAISSTALSPNRTFTDWSINAKAQTHNLPSTFIVRFYLTSDFSSDPNTDIGSWVNIMPSHIIPSLTPTPQISNTSISLTSPLLDQILLGNLPSLAPIHVVPFLREKLSWNIITGQGPPLPRQNLSALALEIVSTSARIPTDPAHPIVYSPRITRYPQVTIGKAGGVAVWE